MAKPFCCSLVSSLVTSLEASLTVAFSFTDSVMAGSSVFCSFDLFSATSFCSKPFKKTLKKNEMHIINKIVAAIAYFTLGCKTINLDFLAFVFSLIFLLISIMVGLSFALLFIIESPSIASSVNSSSDKYFSTRCISLGESFPS